MLLDYKILLFVMIPLRKSNNYKLLQISSFLMQDLPSYKIQFHVTRHAFVHRVGLWHYLLISSISKATSEPSSNRSRFLPEAIYSGGSHIKQLREGAMITTNVGGQFFFRSLSVLFLLTLSDQLIIISVKKK